MVHQGFEVGDFKSTVNPAIRTDSYPIPKIDQIFASLAGEQKCSKIDLSQAYPHIEVKESDREILTIITPNGHYWYNRLPFGISSSPGTWQRAMDLVLKDIPGVACYLDDLLITGRDDDEHWSDYVKCSNASINSD